MISDIAGTNTPPTAQTGNPDEDTGSDQWLSRARSAFRSSTSYVDGNWRKSWEDSIRAFNNMHPSDSKYNAPAYEKRSRLYRPKIRSVIRKNEAAAAAAFFSNVDVVSISAGDQADKAQVASAEVMKQLLQYRLTRTIPWFQVVMGGIQDAQTTGVVCGHVHWMYDELQNVDKPQVDLIPIENIRFDPAASWVNVVETSPYFIHMIPMHAMDIRAKMESGEWKPLPINIATASSNFDSTRIARNANKEDPQSADTRALGDYEIAWVHRHIHRKDNEEYEFYTLGEYGLLTDPVPLRDAVFHGRRPYVIGSCILETHKPMPSSVPTLARGLEDEINEIANQRIDNVKFALNKKWFAKRGVEVDLAGLVRNVPGGVVMMNDPINDVREISWPDVTQSSYMEQQGLDMSMDELLGNFNPAAIMMAGAANAPARNMSMLNQSNGTLVEYLIRTYVETFVQPVLRHLILLEQAYETDRVILGLAAKNSKLLQRFGVDEVTDELLNQEITLTVNVGMGATDPNQKLQKFLTAMNMYSSMLRNPVPGVNMVEVGKEIFGHLGYQDGSRFFTMENPEVAQLQQQLRAAMMQMQQLQQQLKDKAGAQLVSLEKTRESNQSKERIAQLQEENENKRALARHFTQIMGSQEEMPTLPPAQPVAPAPAPRAAPAVKPMSPLMEAKLAAEVEALRTENQLRLKKIESMDAEIQAQQSVALQQLTARTAAVQEAVSGLEKSTSIIGESIGDALGVAVEKMAATMGEAVGKVGDAVQEVGSAVNNFTDTSLENTERALQAISKPKRVVREKGRISRIETE